eukprot:scaffold102960_cov60-Phaeocystis_antarctica.AAC.2
MRRVALARSTRRSDHPVACALSREARPARHPRHPRRPRPAAAVSSACASRPPQLRARPRAAARPRPPATARAEPTAPPPPLLPPPLTRAGAATDRPDRPHRRSAAATRRLPPDARRGSPRQPSVCSAPQAAGCCCCRLRCYCYCCRRRRRYCCCCCRRAGDGRGGRARGRPTQAAHLCTRRALRSGAGNGVRRGTWHVPVPLSWMAQASASTHDGSRPSWSVVPPAATIRTLREEEAETSVP